MMERAVTGALLLVCMAIAAFAAPCTDSSSDQKSDKHFYSTSAQLYGATDSDASWVSFTGPSQCSSLTL